MNEDIWFEEVEEILYEHGVELDHSNDGWYFMFENGINPSNAVKMMIGD